MEVVFSTSAENDLTDIAVYIAHDSPVRALSFADELHSAASRLADMPFRGIDRKALRKGLRQLPHGAYSVYYEIEKEQVRILRIIHGARRLRRKDFT